MAIPEVTPFCIPMHSILNLVISPLYVTSIPITSKFHHCLVTPKFKFSDVFIKPPYSTVLLLIYISRCLQEPIFRSNLSKLRPLMSCVPASYSPSHRYHLNLLQQPEYFDALIAPRCRLMAQISTICAANIQLYALISLTESPSDLEDHFALCTRSVFPCASRHSHHRLSFLAQELAM